MASSGEGPVVDVACATLCRTQPRKQYEAQDYQVTNSSVRESLSLQSAVQTSIYLARGVVTAGVSVGGRTFTEEAGGGWITARESRSAHSEGADWIER